MPRHAAARIGPPARRPSTQWVHRPGPGVSLQRERCQTGFTCVAAQACRPQCVRSNMAGIPRESMDARAKVRVVMKPSPSAAWRRSLPGSRLGRGAEPV